MMNFQKLFYSAVLVVSLSSVLSGCATLGKCSAGDCAGDATITDNVRGLLDQHPELGSPGSIDVQTVERVVYLNGQVEVGLDRNIAETLALQAPGVLKVVNSIVVAR
jgi:osmotically-inducible protein OsmY